MQLFESENIDIFVCSYFFLNNGNNEMRILEGCRRMRMMGLIQQNGCIMA